MPAPTWGTVRRRTTAGSTCLNRRRPASIWVARRLSSFPFSLTAAILSSAAYAIGFAARRHLHPLLLPHGLAPLLLGDRFEGFFLLHFKSTSQGRNLGFHRP